MLAVSIALGSSGCSGSLLKPYVVVEDGTPILLTAKGKVKGAAERQQADGTWAWEEIGYVEIPAGYTCFPGDSGPLVED